MKTQTKKTVLLGAAIFIVLNLVAFPLVHNVQCSTTEECQPVTSIVSIEKVFSPDSWYKYKGISPDWLLEIGYLVVSFGAAIAIIRLTDRRKQKGETR